MTDQVRNDCCDNSCNNWGTSTWNNGCGCCQNSCNSCCNGYGSNAFGFGGGSWSWIWWIIIFVVFLLLISGFSGNGCC